MRKTGGGENPASQVRAITAMLWIIIAQAVAAAVIAVGVIAATEDAAINFYRAVAYSMEEELEARNRPEESCVLQT